MARAESPRRMDPKRERELQQGRHRAMSRGKRDKESHRSFPGEEVEEGELLVRRRKRKSLVGGEEERERSSEDGASVGKDTTAFRKVDGSGERGERNQQEPTRQSAGPREGERGKWPRGRVGTQHAHAQQLDDAGVWAGATAPGPPGLLVVLAARHTAEGESARDPRCELLSETAATMRVPSECSGAEGRAWRSCVWAAGGGGGRFRDFGGGASGRGLVQVDGLAGCTRLGI